MSHSNVKSSSDFLKRAIIQIGAGGSAGFVEVCIMHPMDLVKTRFQLQVKSTQLDHLYYTGVRDCMMKMYKNEGLTSFWKGIIPPIIVETPKRAVKFFTFEQYKQFFLFGANSPIPATFSCAGFFAGVTEGILVNPFEVIKVQLQSNRERMKDSPSTFIVTREIIRKNGFGLDGLNRGLTATIWRNAIFNSFYFGFYHSVKSNLPIITDPWLDFSTKFSIGFLSGTIASCLNIPFDVVKSRIQGAQNNSMYKGTFRTIGIIYKREGFGALYKGLIPKIVRLGPGGAIMLIVYDHMSAYLAGKIEGMHL